MFGCIRECSKWCVRLEFGPEVTDPLYHVIYFSHIFLHLRTEEHVSLQFLVLPIGYKFSKACYIKNHVLFVLEDLQCNNIL